MDFNLLTRKGCDDYRFEYTRNDKGVITAINTVFTKSFAKRSNKVYDPRLNKVVERNRVN